MFITDNDIHTDITCLLSSSAGVHETRLKRVTDLHKLLYNCHAATLQLNKQTEIHNKHKEIHTHAHR